MKGPMLILLLATVKLCALSGVTIPEGADDTSEGSPLFNFVKNVEWDHLIKTFKITGKSNQCKYTGFTAVGLEASMTSPRLIIELTPNYGYSLSLETHLLGKEPLKQGTTQSEGGGLVYSHGLGFNPLGIVFKDNAKGLLCLPSGAIITPLYMSELPGLDEFCTDDFKASLFFFEVIMMINPISILAGAIDCANSEALDAKIKAPLSKTWQGLAMATTPFYFSNGCQGIVPISCHVPAKFQLPEAVGQAARFFRFCTRHLRLRKLLTFTLPLPLCVHRLNI